MIKDAEKILSITCKSMKDQAWRAQLCERTMESQFFVPKKDAKKLQNLETQTT